MNEGYDVTESAIPADAREAAGSAQFYAEVEEQLARLKPEESGEKVGHYKLLQQLGEGGFGTVWLAEQSEPVRRRVALKIIKLGMDTKEVIARFEQERQALAMMDHPNIARVLDAGATPFGRPFFVMELVKGVKITDYCDQAKLSVDERLKLFITVCHAVQHAHQKGIIHRDIKPSNIMVTLHDGVPVPKVIDFGVAKAMQSQGLTEHTLFTQLEQMIGTPLYMSPEQAEMSGLDIDTRSDIYSLGVLLYELLTGRTPFDPEELMRQGIDEMRRVIREQEPPKPSAFLSTMDVGLRTTVAMRRQVEGAKLIAQIRGDLDCIVMMALEKDRSRRYETANGFATDIQRHLDDEPVCARPASRLYRFRRLVWRHKLAFAAAAAVTLALVAGLSVSILSFRREQEQRRIANLQRNEADTQKGIAKAVAIQASEREAHARRLLYAADMILAQQALDEKNLGRAQRLVDRNRPAEGQEDLRGWEWRLLWQQCRGDVATPLTKRDERVFSVSFSPDGRRLAAGFHEGRVELWDVAARTQLRVLEEHTAQRAHVAFSPVGDVLAATGPNGEVKVLDLSQNRALVTHRVQGVVRDLSFSADGVWLAVLSRRKDAADPGGPAVTILESTTGRVVCARDLPPNGSMHFNNARISPDRTRLYVTSGTFETPTLHCLSIPDMEVVWEKPGRVSSLPNEYGFSAMDVSPDGKILATSMAYNASGVQLWDAATGERLRVLDGHTSWIAQVAFSRDGKLLVSASSDQTVRLWNTGTWEEAGGALRGHADEVHTVALTADGQTLATGSKDGALLLWNPSGRERTGVHQRMANDVVEAHPLPGGRTALVADLEGQARLLDFASLRETPLPFPEGKRVKFASPNFAGIQERPGAFVLHEIGDGQPMRLAELPIEPLAKSEIAYSASARLLAWTPDGKTVRITSLDRPTEFTEVGGGQPTEPGRFSEDGRLLLTLAKTSSNGKLAQVWDVASRQRHETAERYLSPSDLPLSSRSRHAISSGSILQWMKVAAAPPLPLGSVPMPPITDTSPEIREFTDRALSPDGRTFAVSTQHGTATIYDALRGKLATLRGRQAAVFGLAFSPDGTRLAMANDVLWDVATQQELLRLSAHGSLHYYAEFTDDGSTLLVGSPGMAGSYQFWRPPSWPEIKEAESKGPPWPPSVR